MLFKLAAEGCFSAIAASFNPALGRVEMHLVSRFDQVIRISGEEFWIGEGESIHTENSYKYWPDEFQDLAKSAGWDTEMIWTDKLLWHLNLGGICLV